MLSHFGSEHYCPLSLLRVHGSSMMEELEDHETDGQEENDNSDSDSDVTVLPPDPSAKVEDQPKERNLLQRAADTVFNLVNDYIQTSLYGHLINTDSLPCSRGKKAFALNSTRTLRGP